MKSGSSKTTHAYPMAAMSFINEDLSDPNNLKGIHSIESILGIKSFEHQQHLFASHLLPSSSSGQLYPAKVIK